MKILNLKLTNFRNIESAHLQISDAPIVALYGENGAGKTSVLEAISLLSPGRGMHRHKFENHTKHEEKTWGLHSEIDSKNEHHTAGMQYAKGKRQLKINGENTKTQSELSALGNVLWFTPKMDRLFMDGASHRREFLDRLAFGHFPEHAHNLNRYKHHLKARLKLLKENAPSDWVDIEEKQAAEFAHLIHKTRNMYLEALKPHLKAVDLTLEGSFERIEDHSIRCIQFEFLNNRSRDARFASNHFGPHRSNVKAKLLPEKLPLEEASSGQHKRAVLEILIANSRLTHKNTGEAPIILLDEMTAHLDSKTKEYFFNSLIELGSQIWLTGTEKEVFTSLKNIQFFKVSNGAFKTD